MARKDISTLWDKDMRIAIDENFKELYSEYTQAGLNAADAREKAVQAVAESLTANLIADEAKSIAERVSTELGQAILEGDSSPLGGQLSVGADGTVYSDPQDRFVKEMNSVNQNLAEITVNVGTFGITPESTDNTQNFNEMVNEIPEGSRVLFPKGTYRGNFIARKSLEIDLQGSTLIPVLNNLPVLRFEGGEDTTKSVVGNPVYGDISFTVDDISYLNVDDIGYLVDGSLRPSDSMPDKNAEVVRIRKINGNTITVYDKIRSNQNTGNVRFVKLSPVKNPSFKNVIFDVPDTHNSTIGGFVRCEGTKAENIKTINSSGVGLEHTLCYDSDAGNIKIIKPYQATSGKGYGVGVAKSRKVSIRNVYGIETRHVVDLDSSYDIEVEGVDDDYALSASVVLSHNGYGGKITAKNIKVTLDNLAMYAVQMSDQGLQDPDKQCFRDILIENIEVTVPEHLAGSLINAVRIINHFSDVTIRKIKLIIKSNAGDLISNTVGVYIRGNPQGPLLIEGVGADRVESDVILERKNAVHKEVHNTIIRNIESEFVRNAVWLKGVRKSFIDNISVTAVGGNGRGLFRYEPHSGVECEEVVIGDDIYVSDTSISGTDIVMISDSSVAPTNGFKGRFPNLTALSNSPLQVTAGYSIPRSIVMKTSGYLLIRTDTGVTNINLNATTPFPTPLWIGQELLVTINAPFYQGSRGTITIPAGSNTVYDNGNPIVLEAGKTYRLIGQGGKWIVTNV